MPLVRVFEISFLNKQKNLKKAAVETRFDINSKLPHENYVHSLAIFGVRARFITPAVNELVVTLCGKISLYFVGKLIN